jgi:hypothetical protein
MADAEQLLERMRKNRFGWGADDLRTVYLGFGFEEEQGSKHTLYIHPDFPELRATVGRHRQLAPGYPTTALRLVSKLRELQGEESTEDDATE